MAKNIRVIVCAANRNKAGKIVAGARHWDIIMRGQILKNDKRPKDWFDVEQGFIDQSGIFLNRQEAWNVAKAAGQIKYWNGNCEGTLFSEDLY